MQKGSKLNVLDLFSGIGGFTLGLERTRKFKTVAFCENDEFCRAVIRKHWPNIPIFDDVRTLKATDVTHKIDVITGSFPCQDISVAQQHRLNKRGKPHGIKGKRSGLWSEYCRLIKEIRPRWVIIENVPALLGRGFATILQNLYAIGYDAEWYTISAADLGAPHQRKRIWIIAYPGTTVGNSDGPRLQGLRGFVEAACKRSPWTSGKIVRGKDGSSRRIKPGLHILAHGVPDQAHRLRAHGNAIVPQIAEALGRAVAESEMARFRGREGFIANSPVLAS